MINKIAQNSLLIDLSLIFNEPHFIELTEWSNGCQWWLHNKDGVNRCKLDEIPRFTMEFILKQQAENHVDLKIPVEVQSALKVFEFKFDLDNLVALHFAASFSGAYQLLIESPFLLWTLCRYASHKCLTQVQTEQLFTQKRTKLLQMVGVNGSKSALKVLNKVHFYQLKDHQMSLIYEFIEHFEPYQIARLQTVTHLLIRFLMEQPHLIDMPWVQNLDKEQSDKVYEYIGEYIDTLNMLNNFDPHNADRRLKTCQTINEIRVLHDRLTVNLNRRKLNEIQRKVEFPPSPLAETQHITYIKNVGELADEGMFQRHCVSSYRQKVQLGRYFVFKYEGEERATIGIRKTRDGFAIDQIRLAHNAAPSIKTRAEVVQWLNNSVLPN